MKPLEIEEGKTKKRGTLFQFRHRIRSVASRRAFTLIELLLVVAILGIASAVSVPYFVKSMRGNRLRSAARTVVMAGRYARSMAVLAQRDIGLNIQQGANEIRVGTVGTSPPATVPPELAPSGPGITAMPPPTAEPGDGASSTNPPLNASDLSLTRILDGVTIQSVTLQNGQDPSTGACTIIYRLNGTCSPYSLRIADAQGHAMQIDVDAFSGAKAELMER